MTAVDFLDLLDWKRKIFAAYARVRDSEDPAEAWRGWRQIRDEVFATHPQSPLLQTERGAFRGLTYFDYDPAYRVIAEVEEAEAERFEIGTSGGGSFAFTRFGSAKFELRDTSLRLDLYWLEGYGGGIFLPFRDATAGRATYGAGRYLLDTVKGADLGADADGRLVLDFNFAYNPSCAYDPRWVCPLAPPPNRLEVEIRAGERY
ncbi:MAG: DUF1684 domain-containing protein [Actinomycetota bacterium]